MLPLWRQPLARSLYKSKGHPESRYLQLATVSLEGLPKNRTLVFRDFDDKSRLLMITDSRTAKWQDFQHSTKAAICWYIASTREQYRLEGSIELLSASDKKAAQERQRRWESLSSAAKQQFLWGRPKTPRAKHTDLVVDSDAMTEVPPDHFELIAFEAEYVDYLNLKGNPQDRIIYTCTNAQWCEERVIP
ncbi:pyridoxamine 5'-phosphate oxidase family protein [Alteromonas sp. ASW11-36]|uniref:Pyridoxamine 5'-phosphate oxidase family protein n=1 Tax=Alteromonas arenosi TaxID=3055817 RepID=A0ABT7SX31_9ALTE|nr:pyridoxamine 5'-phosphate oxidase family protein [Alteromonas sp. ASW11-36]MDM7860737.1 pyridoxamine 5'-phosphate oxidase family protein [Alteromonas sp. ASW11-36]